MTPLAEDLAAGRGPRGEGWRMRGRVPLTITLYVHSLCSTNMVRGRHVHDPYVNLRV